MKKTKPMGSTCLRSTKREEGTPEEVQVERDIASGSGTRLEDFASVNQVRNWEMGFGETVEGERESGALYWRWDVTCSLEELGSIITSMMRGYIRNVLVLVDSKGREQREMVDGRGRVRSISGRP